MPKVVPINLHAPQLPWWRHRWPWLLMAGPFLVVLAGSYTGYLAYTSEDALVVGDYYKQGKAINQDLRRDRAASALGLQVSLNYDAGSGQLRGHITSKQAVPGSLKLQLAHATQPGKDVHLTVQPDAQGNFSAPLALLERSRWLVLVEGEQREWRLDGAWSWPAQREIVLRADPQL